MNDEKKYTYIGETVKWMSDRVAEGKWPTETVSGWTYVAFKPDDDKICEEGWVLASRLGRTLGEAMDQGYDIVLGTDAVRPTIDDMERHRLMLGERVLLNYDWPPKEE